MIADLVLGRFTATVAWHAPFATHFACMSILLNLIHQYVLDPVEAQMFSIKMPTFTYGIDAMSDQQGSHPISD